MIRKVYKLGREAREEVIKGAIFACDVAINTIGPAGRNSLLGRAYQLAELTNDAKTTVADIYLDDEIQQLGVERIKEITQATFDKGGDSTTATCALIKDFLLYGQDQLSVKSIVIETNVNPIKVRNEITDNVEEICKELKKESKPVKTFEDMKKVAFASTENENYADLIASMFNVIGKDGVVTIEDGYDDIIESEIVEGFEIEAGLHSQAMANKEDNTYVMNDPVILVTNIPINFADQFGILNKKLNEEHQIRDLVVIADHFSKEALSAFTMAKMFNVFNVIAIKAPYFGKKAQMQDIALVLGAKFIDSELNISLSSIEFSDLGTCKKVLISKDKSAFIKPKGDVKERIKEVQIELKANKSKFDQEQLKKRLAKLGGGIGVIRVGSITQTNRDYLKKKLLNGVNSVKSALKDGAVKGAGLTLIDIADKLPNNILSDSIRAPYRAIQKNAGGKLKIGDNILDATYNIETALRVAAQSAGDMLTIEFVNADKYETPKDYKEVE